MLTKTFILGENVFTTKKAVDTHVRNILHSVQIGEPLTGADLDCVSDLLLYHPTCNEKIGVGVASICVQTESNWNTRHFQIVRIDGSTTDFSFKKCITPPTQKTLFQQACRHSVADQIVSFRNRVFEDAIGIVYCPVLAVPITPRTSHVDHVPPITFETLVNQFIERKNLNVIDSLVANGNDNCMQTKFADSALQSKWQVFHAENAKLRVVSARANLSDIRKQRSTYDVPRTGRESAAVGDGPKDHSQQQPDSPTHEDDVGVGRVSRRHA